MDQLSETALAGRHRALGAKMVPFAGWSMPLQYDGVVEEHLRVRRACGVFDVSHMGTVIVRGSGAGSLLQRLLTNDVERAPVGRAQYTLLCTEDGSGVVDDLIVSHLDDHEWLVVPNATNVAAVLRVLRDEAGQDVVVEDLSPDWGILALQGPRYLDVLDQVLPGVGVNRFGVTRFSTAVGEGVVSGTGYTGSAGVEILAPAETVVRLWDALQAPLSDVGGGAAGLGARDTLRLEMGYPLHGSDLSASISALEAGLGWVVRLDKGDFRGAAGLRAQREAGAPRRSVGVRTLDRRPPRAHSPVLDADGHVIGEVTSGSYSPLLRRGIGLALVAADSEPAAVDLRGRAVPVETMKPPFVDPESTH